MLVNRTKKECGQKVCIYIWAYNLLAREFRLYMDFDILTGVMDPSEYQSPYTVWILGLIIYISVCFLFWFHLQNFKRLWCEKTNDRMQTGTLLLNTKYEIWKKILTEGPVYDIYRMQYNNTVLLTREYFSKYCWSLTQSLLWY